MTADAGEPWHHLALPDIEELAVKFEGVGVRRLLQLRPVELGLGEARLVHGVGWLDADPVLWDELAERRFALFADIVGELRIDIRKVEERRLGSPLLAHEDQRNVRR